MCIKRCSLPQGFTCLKLQNNCLWEVGVVGDGGESTPDFFVLSKIDSSPWSLTWGGHFPPKDLGKCFFKTQHGCPSVLYVI